MKIKNQNIIITLIISFIIIIALLPENIFSKAEEMSVEYNEVSLSATLYDTNQYGASTGTTLTEDGAEVKGWTHQTSKYLQINPNVPADGSTYIVKVILPQEFYIVASELSTPAGYQDVEFTKNESITINSNTSYDLKTYSGTAEYKMNKMGVSGTIQLEIGYDVVLWDKQEGSILTPEGIAPILVTLSKEDSEGKIEELKELSISKATAGSALVDTIATFSTVEGKETSTVYKDKKVQIGMTVNNNANAARYKYYPQMTFSISLPSYTDLSGTKHFLTTNEESISFKSIKYTSVQIDSSKMQTEGTIIATLQNAYFLTATLIEFEVGPLSEKLQNSSQTTFQFSGGKIIATVEGKNGNTGIQYFSNSTKTITYITEITEKVTVSKGTPNISIVERPKEAVSTIGTFGLRNLGTGESCEKTIHNEFDIENTKLIKVTTINTFADNTQEYIDIKYTLVDENGERVYLDEQGNVVDENSIEAIGEWTYSMKNKHYEATTVPTQGLCNKLSRSMLPESQRTYYFKSIEYTISKIDALTALYHTSAAFSFSSGGNFFGYVSEDAKAGESVNSSIKITSSNADIPELTSTLTTKLQDTSIPSYVLENVKLNKNSIKAGESVKLSGKIGMASYPYNNSTWLKGISLGVILPKDIVINEQAISASTANNIKIQDFTISSKDIGDGNNLWIIKFPSDVYIGYLTEELKALENGISITFNIQLDTSYTMNNFTLFAKDMVMLSGYKQINGANGSYNWSSQVDLYDMNENGLTTDTIARGSNSNTSSCQISAQTATLDIKDNITVERQGSITQEGITQSLLSQDDIVNYNLDISCESGGRAESFVYYVVIPKTTSYKDGFLIEESENGNFDFDMIGEILLTGNDIFNFEYTFEEGIGYEQMGNLTTWYTQEDIKASENLKWQDVTIIRITLKGNSLENGNSTRITVQMKYGGDEYSVEAGMKNIWHSGGFFNYINSERETAGNVATKGVSVDLKYSVELEEISLTAAKDRLPQIEGNVNTYIVEKSKFPQFKNQQRFSITGVDTYNVVLQTKEYMQANTDILGIEANKTFAITVSMEEQGENDILSDAEMNSIPIGQTTANNSPQFTFKIYNADTLTDNSQIRYIVVTMTSDKGVTLRQRININREITQASDPKSAIVAGKRYLTFDDTTTQIAISQDSTFTSQFIVSYIPDTYERQRIVFSDNLPVGTNIMLANLTNENNVTYWYYKVNTEVSTIQLEEFLAMGKTQGENYSTIIGMDIIEERLLIIVDFSQCNAENYMSEDTYTIKMEFTGKDETMQDFSSSELEFVIKQRRRFILENEERAIAGEEFNISYFMEDTEGADSKYEGRKISLILTAPDNIPTDTNLTIGNNTYYLNSNKQFIIPVGDIQKTSDVITMEINSNMFWNESSQYEFNIELWISATANAEAPKLGEVVGNSNIIITAKKQLKPSLKVIDMEKRIVRRNELSNNNIIEYQYVSDTNCVVTIELQQKVGIAYQKITDKLNQVNNTTNHNLGVFNVNSIDGSNKVNFKLSSMTQSGTYRIVFKVNDNNGEQLLQIPYNFIIIE